MITSRYFRVEGSLFSSSVSLFYRSRRLVSFEYIQGDRKSYLSCRRKLYRLCDRILLDVGNLENLGFTVSE